MMIGSTTANSRRHRSSGISRTRSEAGRTIRSIRRSRKATVPPSVAASRTRSSKWTTSPEAMSTTSAAWSDRTMAYRSPAVSNQPSARQRTSPLPTSTAATDPPLCNKTTLPTSAIRHDAISSTRQTTTPVSLIATVPPRFSRSMNSLLKVGYSLVPSLRTHRTSPVSRSRASTSTCRYVRLSAPMASASRTSADKEAARPRATSDGDSTRRTRALGVFEFTGRNTR